MLRFRAAVRISTRTTTAWGRRRSSIMEFLAGLRNLPPGDSLPIFLSTKVHLFAMGLVPDTHSKFYAFILRLPLQRRKRSCLLLFFFEHFPRNGNSETYDHASLKAYNLHSSHYVASTLATMGQGAAAAWLLCKGRWARNWASTRQEGRGPQTKALFHGI